MEDKHNDFKLEWIEPIIEKVNSKEITRTSAKEVLSKSFYEGKSPLDLIKDMGLEVVSDTGAISEIVDKMIQANPKVVEDFKKNPNAAMYIVGQVMKEMGGKADVNIVRELVTSKLK